MAYHQYESHSPISIYEQGAMQWQCRLVERSTQLSVYSTRQEVSWVLDD
jgi:hypothetical protein